MTPKPTPRAHRPFNPRRLEDSYGDAVELSIADGMIGLDASQAGDVLLFDLEDAKKLRDALSDAIEHAGYWGGI